MYEKYMEYNKYKHILEYIYMEYNKNKHKWMR